MEITLSAYVNYRDDDDYFYCFTHAVEKAQQGDEIRPTVDAYDMKDSCRVCRRISAEEDMQAKREILGEVEGWNVIRTKMQGQDQE